MKSTMRSISCALLLPLFFLACSKSDKTPIASVPIVHSKPGVGNIEVVGDSLAYGTGSSDPSFAPAGCLGANFPGVVENLAVPGSTSEEIERTLPAALAKRPKLIFISAGGNDAIHDALGVEVYPPAKTTATMTRIFDTALASNAVVVYLGLAPGIPGSERLPGISNLARSKGIIVVDGMKGIWDRPSLMFDQYHPNDSGYSIMCDRIIDAVLPNYP